MSLSTATLAWRILQAEGAASLGDRLRDRLAEVRRRRRYPELRSRRAANPTNGAFPEAAVLNLLATPPVPWLGGVQIQLAARLAAEAEHRPTALLYVDRKRHLFRLEVRNGPRRWSEEWTNMPPTGPLALRDDGLTAAVEAAMAATGARALHVENLADLPLATLLDLAEADRPVILSLHDFAAFCPRPHLLEQPVEAFCDYSRDLARCARCLAVSWPALGPGFQQERRALAAQLLAAARALVFPSEFLRRTHDLLFPNLDRRRQTVIAPGHPSVRTLAPAAARLRSAHQPLRVAFVGGARPLKGSQILRQVIDLLPGPEFQWTIFGGGEPSIAARLGRLPGVRVRGYYRPGQLPTLLHRHRIDVGLLLSTVPETYSLALDELAAAGVPTLALDSGALGERVRELGAGRVIDPAAGAGAVARALDDFRSGTPPVPRPPPTTTDAARQTLALYESISET